MKIVTWNTRLELVVTVFSVVPAVSTCEVPPVPFGSAAVCEMFVPCSPVVPPVLVERCP